MLLLQMVLIVGALAQDGPSGVPGEASVPSVAVVSVTPPTPSKATDDDTFNIVLFVDKTKGDAERAFLPAISQVTKGAAVAKVILVNQTHDYDKICEGVVSADPRLVIDCTLQPTVTSKVRKAVRTLGIPTISLTYGREMQALVSWDKLADDEKPYLVHLPPPGDNLFGIIKLMIKTLNLKNAAIFYDDSFVLVDQYTSLLKEGDNVRLFIRRLTPNKDKEGSTNFKPLLLRTFELLVTNIFVLAKGKIISEVLHSANELGIKRNQYTWIAVSKDGKPECVKCEELEVFFIEPLPTEGTWNKTVDFTFYHEMAQKVGKIVTDPSWPKTLQLPTCSDGALDDSMKAERKSATLLEHLEKLPLSEKESSYGKYHFANEGSLLSLSVSMSHLEYRNKEDTTPLANFSLPAVSLPDNIPILSNYSVKTFYRITTVLQPPFIQKRVTKTGVEYYGYCIDMIEKLKSMLGFEYILYETEDSKFGTVNEKNQWNGMVKELIDKRADIALGPFTVMAERELLVDFTSPFYELVGITILLKRPSTPGSLFKFLTVLEPSVWACILAALIITSLMLWAFDRLSPYSTYNNREKFQDDEDQREFNLKESFWFCIMSLTPQGGGEAPRNLSGRLVAATWWLFGFIIIASYTANLAAFLTVSRLDNTVTNLDTLMKQYKVRYKPIAGTAAETYFQKMAAIEERFYEIWKNMSLDDTLSPKERSMLAVWDYPVSDKYTKIQWTIKDTKDLINNYDQALDLVKKSKSSTSGFALLADATLVKYAVMTNCELMQVGGEFSRKPLALIVQKGSPLKNTLSNGITQLHRSRFLQNLKNKWWGYENPENKRCEEQRIEGDGIGLDNIGGIFILSGIGFVLTIGSLLFEYWFFTMKEYREKILKIKDPDKIK